MQEADLFIRSYASNDVASLAALVDAADEGNCYANGYFTRLLWNGSSIVKRDRDEALRRANTCIKRLLVLGDEGDRHAQHIMGMFHDNGIVVGKQNFNEAARYYKLASDQGLAMAQCAYGCCLISGDGVAKDVNEAVKLFQLSASQGYANAQYQLSVCYKQGDGVEQSETEAFRLCLLAADQNFEPAQYNIGYYYRFGEGGVTENHDLAFQYFLLSANHGYALAQYAVGNCYLNGIGVAVDKGMTRKYWTLAAEQGQEQARRRLVELV